MITNHTQLLNALIEKYGLKSYLEIGVQNPANNFDRVKCEEKWGVDPCLSDLDKDNFILCGQDSDSFFAEHAGLKGVFDLIFIDGLHTAEQVKRDFENSLRCLSDNGFIVIHDVLPENEEGTIIPRQTKQWWGDVYKWAMTIPEYKGIRWVTYNIDNGCMVVRKVENGKVFLMSHTIHPITWETYLLDGKRVMNVTDEVEV